MNLSTEVKITKVADQQTSAGTAVNGTAIDMRNYDGVLFIGTIGTANAGNLLKVQQGNLSDGSDGSDLEGTAVVATQNGQVVGADVYRPLESQGRYLRPVIIRAGTNTVTGTIYAVQYHGRRRPEINEIAGTVDVPLHVSPAVGTA